MYQWLIPGAVYLGKKDTADKYKDTKNKQTNKTNDFIEAKYF